MTSATVKIRTIAVLLLAIEVSEKKWVLGFSNGSEKLRRRTIESWNMKQFSLELQLAKKKLGLPEDVEVLSCYEASRIGFSLHRYLVSLKIQNQVIDSSSIEVDRRKKQAKTDRIDVKKMMQLMIRQHIFLERKVCRISCVPSRDQEAEMRLHRERDRLKKERTAHCSRIRALLSLNGISVKSLRRLKPEKLTDWEGRPLAASYQGELQRELQRLELVDEQIKELEKRQNETFKAPQTKSDRVAVKLEKLCSVGQQSAWYVSKELFGWRTFRNRKQVGAIAGLVDMPYDSGNSRHQQGISKAGNRRIRWIMVELAWSWLRYQPHSVLSKWFNERFGRGSKRQRRIGIVALARKLLIALWKYVEIDQMPKGAELKKA